MDDHDFGTATTTLSAVQQKQLAADLANPAEPAANEQSGGNVEQPKLQQQEGGQRRVVSVIIDQDEEEEDDEMNISGVPHDDDQPEQTETLFGDHNYVVRVIDHPKQPNDPRSFPTIEGLTIDEKDDYSRMRQQMKQQRGSGIIQQPPQQFDEQSGLPIAVYRQQQQQKMMKTGGARYNAQSPQQFQHQALQHRQSLALTRSADQQQQQRSLSNLRPAASLGRGRAAATAANLDNAFVSGIRIAHSLPPPPSHPQSRQSGGGEIMVEDGTILHGQEYEHFQQPAPMVAPARGRAPAGTQRGGHNKNRRGRGGGRGGAAVVAADYAPPPPGEPSQYIYPSQRKPQTKRQNALQQKREQQKQRELEMQMEEEEQAKTFLEQEEQQNEEFFERQEGKKSLAGSGAAKKRPRGSPRKGMAASAAAAAITERTVPPPADPTHPPPSAALDQDSSKPPDDPFLPPQQQMLLPLPSQQQRSMAAHSVYDSSALDGTINAVIRGEASVMQQRFGPPLTPGGYFQQQSPPPQHFQHQSPYKMSPGGQYSTITSTGRRQQYGTSTSSSGGGLQLPTNPLSHQRLNDLAELANASANLLEQTTSRHVSFQQQQQQFQQAPQQSGSGGKTLHFKVVQTSHQDEPFDQQAAFTHPPQQQVFMVQQRSDQYAQHISSAIPQQSPMTEMMGKRQQRKSTKRTSSTVFEEEQSEMGFAGQMSGTSKAAATTLMPIDEPIYKGAMKKGGKMAQMGTEQMEMGTGMTEQKMAKIEDNTKPKQQRERRKPPQRKEETTVPYETRCICGMTHNDPFMIQCDKCDVWQHGLCMGISEKNVPDEYLCELCQPRKLKNTPKAAANAQQRALKLMEAQKRTKKIAANMKRKSAPAAILHQKKTPLAIRQGKVVKKSNLVPKTSAASSKLSKSFSMASNGSEQGEGTTSSAGGKALDFEETNENGYSRGVRTYSRQVHSMITKMQPFVLGEIGLLKQLEKVSKARPMLVTPQHKGLVATQGKTTMPPGMPIIEYVGQVSLLSEVKALAPKKPINHQFTVIYSGLDERVLIDATKKGSMARFVRRSCRPNATMQHAIIDGRLRFYLYATTNIDNSTEITIPFDYDYRHESTVPIECACGQNVYMNGNQQYCPVADFNKSLLAKEHSPQGRGGGASPSTSIRATRQASNATRGGNSPPKAVVKEEMKSPGPESEGRQLRARNQPSKSEQSPPAPHGRLTRSSTNMEKSPPMMAADKEENVAATKRKSRELKPSSSSYSDFADTPPMPPVNFSQSHPMQAAGSGLTLAKSSRPTKTSTQSSMSPTPRKRGRPSAAPEKGEDKLTAPKVEITTPATAAAESSNANLSREERKMQQTIDAYERAEQMKKRRSEDQQHIKTEPVSPKKPRLTTKKLKTAPSTMAEICKEFGEILRQKLAGVEKEFELPSEYNKLRAKLTEQSKTKQQKPEGKKEMAPPPQPPAPSKSTPTLPVAKKQPAKESPRKSAAKSSSSSAITVTTTTARVSQLQQRRKLEEAEAKAASILKAAAVPIGIGRSHQTGIGIGTMAKQSKEAERKEQSSFKGTEEERKISMGEEEQKQQQIPEEVEAKETTTTESSSSQQQQQLAAELAASRMPNTKAQKKLTIEEYRRKKMADIEAKKGADGTATNIQSPRTASTSSSTTIESFCIVGGPSPTRQSPRKSFIPVVGTGALQSTSSPPQQLEDFTPITSTATISGGSGGRRQFYNTPSLDELKKRILTSAGGGSGASGGTSSSARSTAPDNKFAQQRHSTATTSSHLPADPLPPPPPPQYPKRGTAASTASGESAAERASLDDRLKRLVGTAKRGGGN